MLEISYIKKLFKILLFTSYMLITTVILVACNSGAPVNAGPILVVSDISPIDTIQDSSGSVTITNVGNRAAESIDIFQYENTGLYNMTGCIGETLAPTESCILSFNVPESTGAAVFVVGYVGYEQSQYPAFVYVNWYNSKGDTALTTMSAESNPLSFTVNQTASSIVTITNIGGYTLNNIVVPEPRVLSGSAVATLSNNTCIESVTLPINASCTYTVNVTDMVAESNQQIYLGFNANYAGPGSSTYYSRALLLGYSSQ